jgi:chromate transporter
VLSPVPSPLSPDSSPLGEVVLLFLRLGATAFGGPAAHIALMRQEVVERRRWISDAEFLDLLAASQLIPGPNSTELALHIGHRRAGRLGMCAAGAAFILPAALMTLGLAMLYARYQRTPQLAWLAAGIAPVIVAIIAHAIWELGQSALRRLDALLLAVAAAIGSIAGLDEVAVLMGGGAAMLAVRGNRSAPAAFALSTPLVSAAMMPLTLGSLALVFLKIGAILFGSGYVLVALLDANLVQHRGWLTERQLLDAVAIGQMTPGPVLSTATFIGYLLSGGSGAVVATCAIFAPGFIFVLLTNPVLPRLRQSAAIGAFLDGAIAASLGLMAAVVWTLAETAIASPLSALIAFVALSALLRLRVNATWLILAGAAIGWIGRG